MVCDNSVSLAVYEYALDNLLWSNETRMIDNGVAHAYRIVQDAFNISVEASVLYASEDSTGDAVIRKFVADFDSLHDLINAIEDNNLNWQPDPVDDRQTEHLESGYSWLIIDVRNGRVDGYYAPGPAEHIQEIVNQKRERLGHNDIVIAKVAHLGGKLPQIGLRAVLE
jgi:hypothetical protein